MTSANIRNNELLSLLRQDLVDAYPMMNSLLGKEKKTEKSGGGNDEENHDEEESEEETDGSEHSDDEIDDGNKNEKGTEREKYTENDSDTDSNNDQATNGHQSEEDENVEQENKGDDGRKEDKKSTHLFSADLAISLTKIFSSLKKKAATNHSINNNQKSGQTRTELLKTQQEWQKRYIYARRCFNFISRRQTKRELAKLRLLEGQPCKFSDDEKKELLNWHPDPTFNNRVLFGQIYLWDELIERAHKEKLEDLLSICLGRKIKFESCLIEFSQCPIRFSNGDSFQENIHLILEHPNKYQFDIWSSLSKIRRIFIISEADEVIKSPEKIPRIDQVD